MAVAVAVAVGVAAVVAVAVACTRLTGAPCCPVWLVVLGLNTPSTYAATPEEITSTSASTAINAITSPRLRRGCVGACGYRPPT